MYKKKVLLVLILLVALFILLVILNRFSSNENVIENADAKEQQQSKTLGDNDKYNNSNYTVDELSNNILSNDKETVSKIIQSKTVDINQKNSEGKYPIELVFIMDNCEIAEMLLGAGANSQVVTSNGKTVYDIVASKDNKKLKEIFEKYK